MTDQTNQPAIVTLIRSVPLGKDSGKHFSIPLHEIIPTDIVTLLARDDAKSRLARDIFLVGTARIFVDVQASAKTDAERLAACNKKLDAWREGEMNVRGGGGGGETVEGEVKRLIIAAYMAASGESETKASLKFKGRGFEVLQAIADQKAAALIEAPLEPEALAKDATDEQRAAHTAERETYATELAASIEARKAKAAELYEASKAGWVAKAEASLKAKADARQASEKFAVTDLL